MVWTHPSARHYHLHKECLGRELMGLGVSDRRDTADWRSEFRARSKGVRRCPRCYGSAGKTV